MLLFSDMFHSFGPASGGTLADPSALSFFYCILVSRSVVVLREGLFLLAPDRYNTRKKKFTFFPAEVPKPDIFRLEFVTSREACGPLPCKPLLAQTEAFHNLAIPIRVPAVQIVQ